MKNQFVKSIIVLTLITILAGMGLGGVYAITKEPIALAQENRKIEAYGEVLAEAESFEIPDSFDSALASEEAVNKGFEKVTIDEVVEGIAGGKTVGYVVTVTNGSGYGGDVQFSVGIRKDGTVEGISFLNISESPGLGMEAKDNDEWRTQYYDRSVDAFTVIKGETSSEEEISAISGATITSRAVTGGVNAALDYFNNNLKGGGSNE